MFPHLSQQLSCILAIQASSAKSKCVNEERVEDLVYLALKLPIVHLIDLRNLKSQAPNIFLGSIYMYKDPQKISLQKINV